MIRFDVQDDCRERHLFGADVPHDAVGGGFWTTASAMGEPLIGRLQANAGLTFMLDPEVRKSR